MNLLKMNEIYRNALKVELKKRKKEKDKVTEN